MSCRVKQAWPNTCDGGRVRNVITGWLRCIQLDTVYIHKENKNTDKKEGKMIRDCIYTCMNAIIAYKMVYKVMALQQHTKRLYMHVHGVSVCVCVCVCVCV